MPAPLQALRTLARPLVRSVIKSPIVRVMDDLDGTYPILPLREQRALEVFGYTGEYHTRDYAPRVRSLEVWEIDPACEPMLRVNLPGATTRIVDSFAELEQIERRFDLVVVDNPMGVWGDRCEHFDLFPAIFGALESTAVLVLNVTPHMTDRFQRRYPYLFSEAHLARRRAFYETDHPASLSFDEMVDTYDRRCAEHGSSIAWWFTQKRSLMHYLTLCVTRTCPTSGPPEPGQALSDGDASTASA